MSEAATSLLPESEAHIASTNGLILPSLRLIPSLIGHNAEGSALASATCVPT